MRNTSSWSLRRRLLVSTVAIFVILTSAIAVASVLTMRQVLLDRLNDQVREVATSVERTVASALTSNGGPQDLPIAPFGTILILTVNGEVQLAEVNDGPDQQTYLETAAIEQLVRESSEQPTSVNLGSTYGTVQSVTVPMDAGIGGELTVAIPHTEVNQLVGALTFVIVVSVVVAALALVAMGDALIRRSLRPLTTVIATTERISQLPLDSGEVQLSNRVQIANAATEVGRVGESVNRMLEHIENSLEARAASERKVRQFVADASHELRTPLAAVQGYAEITRKHESALSEESRLSLTRIEAAAGRMASLVNDLLLLARLDEGREIDHDVVDASLLVIDAVADAQAAGPEHPIELDLPEEPVEVLGDLLRLQQVVANLLANARIHTPPGTKISVELGTEVPSGHEVDEGFAVLSIRDNGPGIDPDLQANIFERFVRGDASRSRTAGSSGLGLAIVRAIIEAHGGTIVLASTPGSTAFTLRIPLAPTP